MSVYTVPLEVIGVVQVREITARIVVQVDEGDIVTQAINDLFDKLDSQVSVVDSGIMDILIPTPGSAAELAAHDE